MTKLIHNLISGQQIHAQFIRYGGVAGLGLVIDFATVIFAKQVLGLHYLLAACTGFILGLIVTYILSNKFVFGDPEGDKHKIFLIFALIGIVGLALLNVLMWILTGLLGINYIVSKALATIVVFAWNFLARRKLYTEAKELPYEL